MSDKIKIIIADDHPIFRKGLIEIIELNEDCQIVGEASNGNEAIELIEKQSTDIIILDIDMPEKNGFEAAFYIQSKNINTKVIFLTMYNEKDIFDKAMKLNALGYVLKDSALNEIIDAIKFVNNGKHFISPQLSEFLINRKDEKSINKNENLFSQLTQTEIKILKLISQNKSSSEIAKLLFVSPKTIENHRNNISKKLGLHGKHSLIKFAFEKKELL
ncbi:MAG: response regulator transcription factor [Ignavibacterium sp.]